MLEDIKSCLKKFESDVNKKAIKPPKRLDKRSLYTQNDSSEDSPRRNLK
jgi:hypothetical protein